MMGLEGGWRYLHLVTVLVIYWSVLVGSSLFLMYVVMGDLENS